MKKKRLKKLAVKRKKKKDCTLCEFLTTDYEKNYVKLDKCEMPKAIPKISFSKMYKKGSIGKVPKKITPELTRSTP